MMLDLQKAIFLDFEGYIDAPPSLGGVLFNGVFQQFVLTDVLSGTTHDGRVDYLSIEEFLQFWSKFIIENDLILVGYTSRELSVFEDYGHDQMKHHYYDAHKVLKKWINRNHYKDRPDKFDLESVLIFFDYPLKKFGNRQTTQRIRHMEQQLIRLNQDFTSITPVAKQKWTKVLNYNKQDVEGMLFALDKAGLVFY
jgi:hypothetical protein